MGKAKTLPDYPRGLTFEDVWAALMETRERQERDAREWKEEHERNARELREWREEQKGIARQMKETDKKIGDLGDRFGEMIEHMVMPALVKKFRELGFVFTKAYPEAEYKDVANNIITEVDITLENGDKVMIVEVKSKPNTKDVKEHVKRMEKVRTHARMRNDNRIYLGAFAGMVMKDDIKTFVLKSGFYLIEPSGEEFIITVPEGDYSPREW
ncbi:MAG: hypothetical protein LBQ94_08145 [Treponema sp.]|jgi:hypothetical protein|nr:hypothetical protein [Treponema sp.]